MADDNTAALRARRDRLLGPAYRLFYEEPLHVVRGEGVWLTGADGERYLDAYNNVASVGHCHPHVVGALARQAAVLNTHTRYLSEGVLDYAERLLATFPPEIGHVMFTCTGSEANDLALRVARTVTGGTGVIVTDWAYHGVTVALAEMSPSLGSAVRIGRYVRLVAPPDAYHGDGDVGQAFAARVTAAIEDMRRAGITPAALLVDTIFSSDGVFADPPGFLAPAAAAMRASGGLVIADEVQPGFGRTGDGMWGFARHGLVPDMVTMGKPMGDGHPIAGMAARPEVLAEFGRRTRYFNTFGGNPVSAAVGMAVLDVIEGEGLVANARDTGAVLAEALRALANRHAAIGDVRGAGLFLGVELVRDRATREPDGALAARVVNGLRRRRVLVSSCGRNGNVLKLRPPLVFGREHAEILVDALDRTLADPDGA
ncbi:aspartate aminotransferase family protein [Inquilinus sp.]|jgi:4-aminobutyrate aminotransferase-like enzyme|uniref:aspartate aminotransferase family protein n=1 Tax=Inquilinus sp. TaxID=1932117 RepID=UPI003784011B